MGLQRHLYLDLYSAWQGAIAWAKFEVRCGGILLRRQAFAKPIAFVDTIAQSIMKATSAALPKLPFIWNQTVPAPVRWAGGI